MNSLADINTTLNTSGWQIRKFPIRAVITSEKEIQVIKLQVIKWNNPSYLSLLNCEELSLLSL